MSPRVWDLNQDDMVAILATALSYNLKLTEMLGQLRSADGLKLATISLARTTTHSERLAALHAIQDRYPNVYVGLRMLDHLETVPELRAEVIQLLQQVTRDEFSHIT